MKSKGLGVRRQAVMGGDGAGYRGSFNELGPGADDGNDFHLMMMGVIRTQLKVKSKVVKI